MSNKKNFNFRSEIWLYPGMQSAWHFISVPKELSKTIKKNFGALARGWSSIPVSVSIKNTSWTTSVFWDKRGECYLLPLKAEVRKKENLFAKDKVSVSLKINL